MSTNGEPTWRETLTVGPTEFFYKGSEMLYTAYIPPAYRKELRDLAEWAGKQRYSFDEILIELARQRLTLDPEGMAELEDVYDAARYPLIHRKVAAGVNDMDYTIENQDIAVSETAQDEQEAFDTATVLAEDYRGRKFYIHLHGQPYAVVWWENGRFEIRDIHKPIEASVHTAVSNTNQVDVKVLDIDFAAGQEPTDGQDYVTLVRAEFSVTGRALATALGCQLRVLDRVLEKTPARVVLNRVLQDDTVLTALNQPIKRFVRQYLLDETGEAARAQVDLAEESDLPYTVKVARGTVVVEAEFDVMSC